MDKTKISWCDSTWNPVTGCLHNCEYCYARSIAHRFSGFEPRCGGEKITKGKGTYPDSVYNTTHGESLHVFNEQPAERTMNGGWRKSPYPYDFEPTLHRYRLDEYKNKKGRNIFVCSMADLFGEWVPDEWIKNVFDACTAAPQHRYLFLTKNPKRYMQLFEKGLLPSDNNYWFGSTATTPDVQFFCSNTYNNFLSIEPILCEFNYSHFLDVNWVIIGAETGRRKNIVIPERRWIEEIVKTCRRKSIPVFMKSSLQDIWSTDLIQGFPWPLKE